METELHYFHCITSYMMDKMEREKRKCSVLNILMDLHHKLFKSFKSY